MESSVEIGELAGNEGGQMERGQLESGHDFAVRLLASLGQPVVVVDTEFRVVYWNAGAEQTLGFSAEEILGKDVILATNITLSDEHAGEILEHLEAGEEVVEEFEFARRDGHRFPLLVNLTPYIDDEGHFAGMVAIATDITERHRIEEANSELSAIVESSSDAIVGFDLDGRVRSWNRAASRLFGYPAIEGEDEKAPPSSGPPLLSYRAGTEISDTWAFTSKYVRADGTTLHLDVTVHSVRDRLGSVIGGAAIYRDVSQRHVLERQASEEHQRLEEAQQIARIGSFDYDVTAGTFRCSREFRRITGLIAEECGLADLEALIHPDDRKIFEDQILGPIQEGHASLDATYRIRRAGEDRWVRNLGRVTYDRTGTAVRVIGSTQDITDQVAEEQARRLAEQRFSVAFELGSVGMLILDLDRTIKQVNPKICEMLGRSPEQIIGHSPDEFVHPDDRRPPGQSATEMLLASSSDHLEFEARYLRPSGEVLHTIVHLAVDRDIEGRPVYALAQVVDITDRKRVEDELERLAMQDPLTGLPNRYLLHDRLATALGRAKRVGSTIAVLFVDVDRFKLVNDSLGHAAGDELLRQLARRLGGCARGGDTVARFGGDEFVLVCEDVDGVEDAARIGDRIGAVCEEPFNIHGHEMYVTVSCGIVLASRGDTPVTLMRDADIAMYRAKEKGRARSEIFSTELRRQATQRLDIELALRHALERGEFRLDYQPIVELPSDRAVAVEALIRWEHPERGLVAPAEFVPAAEETGLIVAIGEWVLDRAVAEAAKWRRTLKGAEQLMVAVNLSPRQLMSSSLLARARDALAAYGLPPEALCLEITESTAMDDLEISLPTLRRIADSGIVVAIDDFGAGYSSLGRLKSLPVGTLKIDGSFVDGLGMENDDTSIVHAIVSLGQALNLTLCAEGVETEVQRAELVAIGCQRAQGYLWSKPLSPEDFEVWFANRSADPAGS
jgi:diguanylate cyclase (GGDEF)-like protein/PAS domain S-box-containing protein